jgi:hypothetical protein
MADAADLKSECVGPVTSTDVRSRFEFGKHCPSASLAVAVRPQPWLSRWLSF